MALGFVPSTHTHTHNCPSVLSLAHTLPHSRDRTGCHARRCQAAINVHLPVPHQRRWRVLTLGRVVQPRRAIGPKVYHSESSTGSPRPEVFYRESSTASLPLGVFHRKSSTGSLLLKSSMYWESSTGSLLPDALYRHAEACNPHVRLLSAYVSYVCFAALGSWGKPA